MRSSMPSPSSWSVLRFPTQRQRATIAFPLRVVIRGIFRDVMIIARCAPTSIALDGIADAVHRIATRYRGGS